MEVKRTWKLDDVFYASVVAVGHRSPLSPGACLPPVACSVEALDAAPFPAGRRRNR
jgi:hypothetical protein